jgi:DNA-binding CsgD family transcriptional regulator
MEDWRNPRQVTQVGKALEASDAQRFYAELQQQPSVAACSALFKSAVAQFGIVAFACGEVDLAHRERNVLFIAEWPKAWLRYYVKSGFIERDPIINALGFFRKAYSFVDILHDRRFSSLDREAIRATRDNGWTCGLAVPVARGGTGFGLVTLIGCSEEFEASHRAHLCLISECLLSRVHSLRPNIDYAMAPAGMSRRQVEAARLVALGCSDLEIASKLRVSESTAHKHVEAGRKRLKARNRAHMAALSVSLGIATAA